ncbi:hypothetical protein [Streptomyces sp. NPDC002758]
MDVHHHFTAPAWLDWAEAQGLVRRDRLPWWTRWDLDSALALMDRTGIRTTIMTVAMLGRIQERSKREESARVALLAAAEVAASHPTRFAAISSEFPRRIGGTCRSGVPWWRVPGSASRTRNDWQWPRGRCGTTSPNSSRESARRNRTISSVL